jgi:adenylate cyclase class IV
LGWFIELEILVDAAPANEKIIVKGKAKLLALLDSLGVAREEIESRYYSDLLKERAAQEHCQY